LQDDTIPQGAGGGWGWLGGWEGYLFPWDIFYAAYVLSVIYNNLLADNIQSRPLSTPNPTKRYTENILCILICKGFPYPIFMGKCMNIYINLI